ncbi:hypothetical protein N7499_008737 [Penicillium canescens]|nr:hypothetical protein N7499_008737 [Penicillium canescens]KAJ6159066.1 hypothetical protein N7485_011892 [Penicillium canescens]
MGDQCQEGKVYCCSPEKNFEDKGLLTLLSGFNLLGFDAKCAPVTVLGNFQVALLGTNENENGNVDCKHTLACCTGADCRPLGM